MTDTTAHLVVDCDTVAGSPADGRRAPAKLLRHVLLHVLPATILFLLGITLAESFLVRQTYEEEVNQRLSQQATQVAAVISAQTQALIDAAAGIAENDLVVNGLIDIQDRESYIPVYFQELRLPGPSGARVTLADYRGRMIASNASGRSYESEPWVDNVMAGERATRIDQDGMILAFPVKISGRPEGIIVVDLDPVALRQLLSVPVLVGAMAVHAADGTVLFSSDDTFLAEGKVLEGGQGAYGPQWVAAGARIPYIPELEFMAGELRSDAFRSVTNLYRLTGLVLVFSVAAVGLGIVTTAWLTTKPIRQFAEDMEGIRGVNALSYRAKPSGFAELHSLAHSFNTMLERLERTTTSRDHVDTILNSIGEMLLVTDREGRIRRFNRAFARNVGGNQEALLDRPIESFLENGEYGLRQLTRGEVTSIEGALKTETGRTLPVQVSATRMMGDGASREDRIFVLVDISERKESEQLLQRRAQELARSNAELQQFASVASHDLQEPLRKVQAFSDRLRSKYRDQLDEQGQDYLTRIEAATSRMQALIVDLLAFSQVGRGELRLVAVDLGELVRGVVSDLEIRIQESDATIDLQDLPTVRADPMQMRQLFQNLIGNGIKYRRKGVPPLVRIHAHRASEGGACNIEVADNGIGFEQEHAERIFGIFQRLHGRSAYQGTGVGLAICRKICERHGGSIVARGRPGGGATFTVVLPGGDAVRKVA